jgi:hypothetical protein
MKNPKVKKVSLKTRLMDAVQLRQSITGTGTRYIDIIEEVSKIWHQDSEDAAKPWVPWTNKDRNINRGTFASNMCGNGYLLKPGREPRYLKKIGKLYFVGCDTIEVLNSCLAKITADVKSIEIFTNTTGIESDTKHVETKQVYPSASDFPSVLPLAAKVAAAVMSGPDLTKVSVRNIDAEEKLVEALNNIIEAYSTNLEQLGIAIANGKKYLKTYKS